MNDISVENVNGLSLFFFKFEAKYVIYGFPPKKIEKKHISWCGEVKRDP